MSETLPAVSVRDDNGHFLPGKSGNPQGRPKSRRNELIVLKQDLEIAVRETLPIERVKRIVNRVAQMAEDGNMAAAKLLLDKIISNASDAEDVPDNGRTVVFRIQNATFAAKEAAIHSDAIEVEVTEVVTDVDRQREE